MTDHMNYELRGKNHTMCDWLGFSKEGSLYPNHVRAFTAAKNTGQISTPPFRRATEGVESEGMLL